MKETRTVLIEGRRREIEVEIPELGAEAEAKKEDVAKKIALSPEDADKARYDSLTVKAMKDALTTAEVEFDAKAKKPELYELFKKLEVSEESSEDDL